MSNAVADLKVEMGIAVFAKGTRVNGAPAYLTDEDSATYLVDVLRIARWVNRRHKSILMLCEPSSPKMRDQSCRMGAGVTVAALLGSRHHRALVDGWRSSIPESLVAA